MKKYKEKEKQDKLKEIMHNRTQVSFRVLEELERDEIMEDYDLFRVVSKIKKDPLFIFYLDGQYYMVDENKKDFKLIENKQILKNRYFLLSRCITNGVQGFMQRKGINAFYELSTKEFVDVLLNHSRSLLNDGEER